MGYMACLGSASTALDMHDEHCLRPHALCRKEKGTASVAEQLEHGRALWHSNSQQLAQAHEGVPSKNHSVLRRPLRPSSPTSTHPTMSTNHVPQCHIYTVLEHLQGWWHRHLFGQPMPGTSPLLLRRNSSWYLTSRISYKPTVGH